MSQVGIFVDHVSLSSYMIGFGYLNYQIEKHDCTFKLNGLLKQKSSVLSLEHNNTNNHTSPKAGRIR